MKKDLLFLAALFSVILTNAQVTQINNNNSLEVVYPLAASKTILSSEIDSSIWVSDATLAGTVQISPNIKYEGSGAVIGGNFIFSGYTPATGVELYMTDGTPGGTVLLKDIYSGTTGSRPGDFILFNGDIYFSAVTAANGRELWKTDGTSGGTAMVLDIVPGTDSSNNRDAYWLTATASYMLFAARTPSIGVELWKSDGTSAGTVLLKDINMGSSGADSSNPRYFYHYNSLEFFIAGDATNGEEIWKTDGTPGGTVIVKDINAGTANSTTYDLFPGFPYPIFNGFHAFNSKLYFTATDGASTGEMWVTDGTAGNTTLVKDIIPGVSIPIILLVNAVNLPAKFMFGVSDGSGLAELWESDGTNSGTKVFKTFTPNDPSEIPFIFISYSYDFTTGTINIPLFMGNKFFFIAGTMAEGYELWISDGTLGGTTIVKDINPGAVNGMDPANSLSYLYTQTNLFFAATDATHGNELWESDGTSGGTALVKDIYLNAGDAAPQLSLLTSAGKIFFTATDGDDANHRDLFVVNGSFQPLPIQLTDFTVTPKTNDALLQWSTLQETNSKDFTVQRSYDALHFENIGMVQAAGTTSNRHTYSFTDGGIINSGKSEVYYRLLATDKDGKNAYSKVLLLKIKANTDWIVRMLSNPVRGNVNVLLRGITGTVKLSIKDITGKTVFTNTYQNTNGQITLNANLQSGTYILVAENNNERKITKFIK